MDDPHKSAIIYLASSRQSAWHWTDDGDVLAWKDGTTIAFRQEIIQILEWLIPHEWPPFDALVLLLAAFRGKVRLPDSGSFARSWAPTRKEGELDDGKQLTFQTAHEQFRQMQASVENDLSAVSQLPADLRASWKAKATVAEMLFGQKTAGRGKYPPAGSGKSPECYHSLLEIVRSGVLTDTMLNNAIAPTHYIDWSWQIMHEGFGRMDLETLELRLRTGLDEVPHPAPVPIPPATRVRQVIEELQADAEHSGFARLVRDFMAAIQLPRRLSEQDEMPIGGFADITNRGNPDRLLLSELAHDDLTLAVRIAVNEALYLRREPPAKEPPSTLAILLDSGVRLWGTPRVLATAVALALVAKSSVHEKCTIFRASGHEIAAVDLLSREGVIAHLGKLEPHAHPGLALTAFHTRLQQEERPEGVLITHREVWEDPDFQSELARAHFDALYVALVERDGHFALLRHPHGGSPLCAAQVDIEALFPPAAEAGKRPMLVDRTANPELPLILSRKPFPLLIPVLGTVQKSIRRRNGGGACVMKDRRLLVWDPAVRTPSWSLRGARTVTTELPLGRAVWLGELPDGSLCVAKTINGLRHLTCRVFSLEGALLHSHDWELTQPALRVDIRSDVIFVVCTDRAQVHDLKTGAMLSLAFLSPGNSHGRYFLNHRGVWCVLSWNGQQLNLDPIVFLNELPGGKILQVFHNEDSVMPWAVLSNGKVYNGSGTPIMQLGELRVVLRVADDGRRLLVLLADGKKMFVDLPSRKKWPAPHPISDKFWFSPSSPLALAVRRRIHRLGFTGQGKICLGLSADRWCWLGFAQGSESTESAIVLHSVPTEPPKDVQDFVPVQTSSRLGYSLKMARWQDGRRAWIDSCGLLHLRCANPKLPELTLCLGNERLAAWTGTDLAWGDRFFIGDNFDAPAEEIWAILKAFAAPAP
ncbi:hypothetical protein EV701_111132 [Chthoniobacter flavus]|uniref:hypothetical protein n=1 Tax=Chthoniobacter flavus TaxID=191863 RepID=UPI0010499517|nr:hypothetical protein [Chthoniobacter flavus]TCO90206.1 hypothetical protein EV701_111132 [Chthoniobacter flavus]